MWLTATLQNIDFIVEGTILFLHYLCSFFDWKPLANCDFITSMTITYYPCFLQVQVSIAYRSFSL